MRDQGGTLKTAEGGFGCLALSILLLDDTKLRWQGNVSPSLVFVELCWSASESMELQVLHGLKELGFLHAVPRCCCRGVGGGGLRTRDDLEQVDV